MYGIYMKKHTSMHIEPAVRLLLCKYISTYLSIQASLLMLFPMLLLLPLLLLPEEPADYKQKSSNQGHNFMLQAVRDP